MGANLFGAKALRRLQRQVDPLIDRAFTDSTGRIALVVTSDHRHGEVDRRTRECEWLAPEDVHHFASCRRFEQDG